MSVTEMAIQMALLKGPRRAVMKEMMRVIQKVILMVLKKAQLLGNKKEAKLELLMARVTAWTMESKMVKR